MNKLKKWLISVIFLSFAFSIGYSFYYKIKPQVDARAYDVIAQNILSGKGFIEQGGNHDTSLLRVGPIYEYFLAGIYKVFGYHYELVWIIQAILHALSAYLIYLICLSIFKNSEKKEKIGLWAAVIFGFYPDLIEISAMLMTETLYLFFVCLLVYIFFKYLDSPSKLLLVSLGVVSGLAVLARPPMLFCLPIVVFYFLKNKKWKETAIYILIMCAIFTPWAVRNYNIYGATMPFGQAGALNFWIGNHVGANGEQETNQEISNFINTHNVVEIGNESISQFENFIFSHPVEFIGLTFSRANKYFSILRPMGFWFYTSGWRQLLFVFSSAVFSFFVLVFSLAGIIRTIKFKEKSLYYLLAFTILTPLILFITVVETRYRFQIYPFLAIFAAYFIESFNKQNKKIWLQTLFLAFVIIVANGLIDGLINFDTFKAKIISHLG